jgi:hypothetical protein
MNLSVLGGGTVDLATCTPAQLAGATLYHAPDGRWLAPAFARHAVALDVDALPDSDDEDTLAALVLDWVQAVRAHDWSDVRGAPLEGDGDWVDLRTAMVRVGWGPGAAHAAWGAAQRRPYAPALPTAAGWAGAGWVVPALPDEPDAAFARPVLEARGLLRWAYITRWDQPAALPASPLPAGAEPDDPAWADVLSRLRQDHYTEEALAEAEELAVELLRLADLGPRSAIEAEDEPLPDRDVAPACTHPSPVVRAAAWFLLRAEADAWLACAYAECQHHWAVEAEEDAYELEEVLEFAGYGLPNPVDAAHTRRRLLTLAFGDIVDVPLAGAGDVEDFLAFYREWVAHGRPEDALEDAARELRGDA